MGKSNFFNSVVRGAGSELGHSTMRAVINPVLKGKDANYISTPSTPLKQNENFAMIDNYTVKIGKEFKRSASIMELIFAVILTIVPLIQIFVPFMLISAAKKMVIPVKIFKYDRPYYKSDGRFKSGYRKDDDAVCIESTESEVSPDAYTMAKIFNRFAYFLFFIWGAFILLLIYSIAK